MKKELKRLLKQLDIEKTTFSYEEYKIADQINKVLKKNEFYTNEEIAEEMAFNFVENNQLSLKDLNGDVYYGPRFIFSKSCCKDKTKDKTKVDTYPSVSKMNREIIKYWEERAKKSKNHVLKSRYADLVIEFKPKILKERADFRFYEMVINSNIIIYKRRLVNNLSCQIKLKRALILELQVKKEISKKLKHAIIELDKQGKFNKRGTWGFAFRWLILNKNKKIKLTKQEKDILVTSLIDRFNRSKSDPYLLEYTTSLLADFYKQEGNKKKLLKILLEFKKEYKKYYNNKNSAAKFYGYKKLLEAFDVYLKFLPEIKKEKDEIIKEIGKLELDKNKNLKQVSTEIKIPKEKIKRYLDNIFGEDKTINNVEKIIVKIIYFIYLNLLSKDDLKKLYKKIMSECVFQHIVTQEIRDSEGLVKAQLGSNIENLVDLENSKFIIEASKSIQFNLCFLNIIFYELKKRFKSKIDDLFFYLINKDLFKNINHKVLKRILKAYFENDYLVFSHLAMPLIEKLTREFIKSVDGVWVTTNKYQGFEPLTLHQMLNNESNKNIFKQIFGKDIGENIIFYFKILLTEKFGMEIRTDIAHGKNMEKFFDSQISDLLFYLLLIFSVPVKKTFN